jgi:hypothetical protein
LGQEKALLFAYLYLSFQRSSLVLVRFNTESSNIFKSWVNNLVDLKQEEEHKQYAGIYSKMENIVPRVALILQSLDDVNSQMDSQSITIKSIKNAIKVGEYYIANAKKILEGNEIDMTDKKVAAKLLLKQGLKKTDICKALNIKSRTTLDKYLKE